MNRDQPEVLVKAKLEFNSLLAVMVARSREECQIFRRLMVELLIYLMGEPSDKTNGTFNLTGQSW